MCHLCQNESKSDLSLVDCFKRRVVGDGSNRLQAFKGSSQRGLTDHSLSNCKWVVQQWRSLHIAQDDHDREPTAMGKFRTASAAHSAQWLLNAQKNRLTAHDLGAMSHGQL